MGFRYELLIGRLATNRQGPRQKGLGAAGPCETGPMTTTAAEEDQARWHSPSAGPSAQRRYEPVDEAVNEWLRERATSGRNRAVLARLERQAAREAGRVQP